MDKPVNILIVDDVLANRKMLARSLANCGYITTEAENGMEAIRLYDEVDPDMILMDVNMPEMDGYEAATRIKKKAGWQYTPIIFVTALTVEDSLTTALESGGDDFINKPVNIDILKSKINAHLRIRELSQELSEKNKLLEIQNEDLILEKEMIEHFFDKALKQSYFDPAYIKYHISPMSTFNGDVLLIKRGPEGGLFGLLGDFTGHGLRAAMGTLPVVMIFFKMAQKGLPISMIANEINRQLLSIMPIGMFCAATLFELDKTGEQLAVWSGGMPGSYWLDSDGGLKGVIQSSHLPLGIVKDEEFDSSTQILQVEKGDKFYCYSDGVIEAGKEDGERFGEERLRGILLGNDGDRFEKVLLNLNTFRQELDQDDDVTFLELTCESVDLEQVDVIPGETISASG
ncbi:MAG TPA: fused response regulator/phosphatase [Gammaproteobacteria bacterium]|nr:fused response regulator/phosphatase [Gammaproteobacteria bacterium]